MFGGLEVKGAASKDAEDEPDPNPSPPASSFGFMNATAPVPAQAPAPLSSFSFLNADKVEPTPAANPPSADDAPATPASGFSFMMQESTTTTTDQIATNPPSSTITAPSSSGFDFMNPTMTPATSDAETPAAVVEETIIPTITEEAPASALPPASSGFSFLSESPSATANGSSAAPPAMPTTIHTRTNSASSASSALSSPAPATNLTPAKAGGIIAGSGVTFGTSSAKPRIKKKKMRSAKVGVGVNHISALPAATPPPAVAPATAPAPSVAPTENKSSHSAALEATNRAEAFMQAKALEEVKESKKTTHTTTPLSSTAVTAKSESVADLELETTESTDDVIAAAQEAAEKAKILQHQQKGKSSGFMGTFFKGFRAAPNTTSISSSSSNVNNSRHSASSQSVGSNSSGAVMDRLAHEQQVMKQAMAKRQLEQQKEQPTEQQTKQKTKSRIEDENDDEVVVSTSVNDYKPVEIVPVKNISAGTNADSVTVSEGSSFAPVTLPAPTQKSSFSFMVPTYGEPNQDLKTPIEPTVKMDNTPKQKFEGHQEYFSESVNQAMKKVEDARNLKKGLLEERFVALAKERFATREIEQIEELLQAAIDEEDYEQADELGQKLDAHKREKSEVANMLASNKTALESLDSENTSLGELVVSCFEDLAIRLNDLKEIELASEKKDDDEILSQYASISKQLSAEHERLQQDLKHLERDEQLVGEERKELEDSIKDQTGEIETLKEETSLQLVEAEKEIEELRNTIQRKQKEAADLRTKVFGFEDSISKVRVKFSRQLTRVDKKEVSVKESRREWEIENEQHKKQRDAHELQVQTHSDTLLAHDELMKTLDSELQLSKEFSQFIPTQLGFMDDDGGSEEKEDNNDGSLAQLKANVVKCEGAIDVAKKALKTASLVIQNLENERDMLVIRIPELESSKKSAAAGRDFKAAGKFSKEIKDANARIKVCEDDLNGDAKAKKATAEETLRRLDSELLEAKKIADASEKSSGENRMKILGSKIAQLVKEKIEKCGEFDSTGKSVKSVAARVLEGQIMILKAEGCEIGSKYGGWDELMISLNLDDKKTDVEDETPTNTDKTFDQKEGNISDDEVRQEEISGEERLQRAKDLLARCTEVEAKIQEAADEENFEMAGELQEALDKINLEIEELNLTDEDHLLLAPALGDVPPEQDDEEVDRLTDEERLQAAKVLLSKLSELEQKVRDAAEIEDFETAEEFQTSLDDTTAELAKLNITDTERESLTTGNGSSDVISSPQEESEEANDEEKKEGDEQNASDFDHEKVDETSDEVNDTADAVEVKHDAPILDDESESSEKGN